MMDNSTQTGGPFFPTLGWNIFHPLTTVYNFHLSQKVEILWVLSTHRVENFTL